MNETNNRSYFQMSKVVFSYKQRITETITLIKRGFVLVKLNKIYARKKRCETF